MDRRKLIFVAIIILIIGTGIIGYYILSQRISSRQSVSKFNPVLSESTTPNQIQEINSSPSNSYKDVRYFFDNIESFNKNLPRSNISESITIRGRLVVVEVEAQCWKEPCPSVKDFELQDIDNESYKILIYQGDILAHKLEVGKIYILKGVLKKSVDFGRRIVFINNFEPEEVVGIIQ